MYKTLRILLPSLVTRHSSLVTCLCLLAAGCRIGGSSVAPGAGTIGPAVRFTDVTPAAGLHFRHENGAAGKKYMPETMGSGCAFIDFDNDGWQDILLVNGEPWAGVQAFRRSGKADAARPARTPERPNA